MLLGSKVCEKGEGPEPWLTGGYGDVDALRRGVLHAFDLGLEELEHWCGGLSDAEMNARPFGIAPVAFHLRHIARSLDRLLTYAEGGSLSGEQLEALRGELTEGAKWDDVFAELRGAVRLSSERVRAISAERYEEIRAVGREQLGASLGGLLVHLADHTQRHVGQAITTAKVVVGQRQS